MGKYNKKNIRMAKKPGAVVLPYKDLPQPYQLSIAWYMAVNGEAWDFPHNGCEKHLWHKNQHLGYDEANQKYERYMKRMIKDRIDFYISKYGHIKFGQVEMPSVDLCLEIFQRNKEIHDDFDSFQDYQKWYLKHIAGDKFLPRHRRTDRWPCIISGFDDDVLEDGWHRFHCYVKRKDPTVPCIFFT